uniref:ATP synthase subunit a n=1 Tax=Zhengitettix curvispinus TaxID=2793214 RepID=A0A7T0NC29_9ORTH|nr:ATP synthase F0 subunit 6 [Zhengitettix curvispinus]
MMTNLFSSFDPSTNMMNMSLNWTSTIMMMYIMPMSYWLNKSRSSMVFKLNLSILNKEFYSIINHKSGVIIFISMFIMIMMNNFLGLFPYIFTSSSHMVMTLSIALPMWLSFNLFGWMKKTNYMFSHLLPLGTPSLLMPFMVCIETISNLIRPGTLAIRLAANMIAGHLLLTLLGNSGSTLNNIMLLSMLSIQMMLLMLESAVSIIQAYVFSILLTLYSSEIN